MSAEDAPGPTEDDSANERPLFLHPIGPRNAFEVAVAQLARAIRIGAIGPGEKLPAERLLAEHLQLSRSTVREVMRALETSGFVTTRRGRFGGTFVVENAQGLAREARQVLPAELLQAIDCRVAVEPGVARLAAERATEEQLAQLGALLPELEAAERAEYVRLNTAFHIKIAEATQTQALIKLVSDYELEIAEAMLNAVQIAPGLLASRESHAQHRLLVDAIAARDGDRARTLMEEHLSGSSLVLRELVNE
jgi:DNA-binding FadR family transcriptional regulator